MYTLMSGGPIGYVCMYVCIYVCMYICIILIKDVCMPPHTHIECNCLPYCECKQNC